MLRLALTLPPPLPLNPIPNPNPNPNPTPKPNQNTIIGNAASGGWAGFALPELPQPVMAHRGQSSVTPSSRTFLAFDGNTAHSTGFWWDHAGAIYVGGKLWHPTEGSDALRYNPGRQNPNPNPNANINRNPNPNQVQPCPAEP